MPSSLSKLAALLLAVNVLVACRDESGGGAAAAQAQRVILITCDTLRADRLGAYGFGHGTTPTLDSFAKQCVVYDRAYAAAPMTMPAFASMMTGFLPDHTGVVDNHVLLPASVETMAETLAVAGFETAAVVSNWVLRSRPAGAGVGVEQGFAFFDDTMNSEERTRKSVKERVAPDTTDAALAWLQQRSSDHFFLWVHYQDPHGPYTPPKAWIQPRERSAATRLPLGRNSNTTGNIPHYQILRQNGKTDFYQDRYEAEIRYFDHELARLFEALEEQDLIRDALLIFTADHGESLGEHDWWFSHGQSLYDELVHVPLMIHFPGMAGEEYGQWEGDYRRNPALVGHLDLLPTVRSLVGLPQVPSHGQSLLGPKPQGARYLAQSVRVPEDPKRWLSVTDGRWRLLQHNGRELLFDLQSDPLELQDKLASEPVTAARLRAQYALELNRVPSLAAKAQKAQQSEQDAKDLGALGYSSAEDDDQERD